MNARLAPAEIRKFYVAVKEIDRLANDQEFFGLFRVDTRSFKDSMIAKANGVGKGLMQRIVQRAAQSNAKARVLCAPAKLRVQSPRSRR